jgi:hypothetical protein
MLRQLKQTRQRYRLQLFLHGFATAAALLASFGILLLLAARYLPGPLQLSAVAVLQAGNAFPLRALLPAVLLAFSCGFWRAWRQTPTLQEAARRADRHFGLAERLSTSLEAAASTAGQQPASELLQALHADAEAVADRVIPEAIAPLKLPATLGWWLTCSLLAFSLLQLRHADSFLLLPAPGRPPVTGAGVAADPAADVTDLHNELLAQLLNQPPGRPAAEPEADRSEQRSEGQPPGPQERGSAKHSPAEAADDGTAVERDAAGATRVDRAGDAAAQDAEAETAARSPAEAAAPSEAAAARNDGSTNPSYGPDATRDQELREQARRQQQKAGNPGAGGGDQAALADSSVAGDATAGFEGNEAGVIPDTAEQGGELSLPDQVNSSGERIEVELPPEARATEVGEAAGITISWNRQPAVTLEGREELRPADRELLQRYHSLTREGNARAQAGSDAGRRDTP